MNGINPKIKDGDDISKFEMKDIVIYVDDLRNRQQLQVVRTKKLNDFRQAVIKMSESI